MADTENTPTQNPLQIVDNSPEIKSDNYYEQVNGEFEYAIVNLDLDANTIDEIKKRNETSFLDKIKDAISNPEEAMKWFKTSMMATLANSWLGEMFGFKEELRKKKEAIMEALKNPVNILTGVLAGFAGFKILKGLANFANPMSLNSKAIKLGLKGIKLAGRTALLGGMVYGSVKLYEYFTKNPTEAQKMPHEKGALRIWWQAKIKDLGLKDELAEHGIKGENNEFIALLMGEKTAKEIFAGDLEYEEDEKNKEKAEQYGDLEPLGNKFEAAKTATKKFAEAVLYQANQYKYSIALVGLAVWEIEMLKKLSIGSAKLTGGTLLTIGDIFKKVAVTFPFAATFGILGIVYGLEESKDLLVPKDPDQFKQYLKDALTHQAKTTVSIGKAGLEKTQESYHAFAEKVNSLLAENNVEINTKEVDEAIDYIQDEGNIEKMKEELSNIDIKAILDSIVDKIALSPDERIKNANVLGISTLSHYLRTLFEEGDDAKEFQQKVKDILIKIKNEEKLNNNDLIKLAEISPILGITIYSERGYYYWAHNENGITKEGPKALCIDPNADNQHELAKRFHLEDSLGSIFETSTNVVTSDIREILYKEKEALEEGKAALILLQGQLILEGVGTKYFLGTYEMGKNIVDQFMSENDFDVTEFAAVYAGGIAPIMVIGAPNIAMAALNRGFKGVAWELAKIATYPASGPFSLLKKGSHIKNMLKDRKTAKKWMKKNPVFTAILRARDKSKSLYYNALSLKSKTNSEKFRGQIVNLTALNKRRQALRHLYQAKLATLASTRTKEMKLATEYLDDFDEDFIRKNLDVAIKEIELKEANLLDLTNNFEYNFETEQLEKAKKKIQEAHAETNNPRKKKKLLSEARRELGHAGIRGEEIAAMDLEETNTFKQLERNIAISEADLQQDVIQEFENERKSKTGEIENTTADSNETTDKKKDIDSPESADKSKAFESLSEQERIDTIKKKDKEFVLAIQKHKEKRKSWLKKANFKRQNLANSEEILRMDSDQKTKLKDLYQQRVHLTEKLHALDANFDFEKHHLQLDEDIMNGLELKTKVADTKVKSKGALDKAIANGDIDLPKGMSAKMKGGFAIAAVLALTYITGAIMTENTEERDLAEAFKKEKEQAGNNNKESEKKNIDSELQAIDIIKENLNSYQNEYSGYLMSISTPIALSSYVKENPKSEIPNDVIDLRNLRNPNPLEPDQRVISYVNNFTQKHNKMSAEIMITLVSQQELINKAFKNSPTLQKDGLPIVSMGEIPILKIKWDPDKETAYLQYADEEDFMDFSYSSIDHTIQTDTYNDSIGGDTQVAGMNVRSDIIEEIGGNFVPFYGSYRDLWRAGRNFHRGNWKGFRRDYAYGASGALLDSVTLGEGSTALKAASVAADAAEPAYNTYRTAAHREETFENRYYAFSAENAQDIPFESPGTIRMSNKPLENQDFEKFQEEVENKMFAYISGCYWKNANFEIIDINTIKISRITSNNEVTLTRESDNSWNLDGDLKADGGYTFEQAFAMANLSNKTMEWLEKENITGDSENPFHEDGTDIEFDRNYDLEDLDIEYDWTKTLTPTDAFKGTKIGQDTVYLRGGSNSWIDFYDMSFDIPKNWMVNLLNRTYKKHKRNSGFTKSFENIIKKHKQQ